MTHAEVRLNRLQTAKNNGYVVKHWNRQLRTDYSEWLSNSCFVTRQAIQSHGVVQLADWLPPTLL